MHALQTPVESRGRKRASLEASRLVWICLGAVALAAETRASAQSTVDTISDVAPNIVKIFGAGGRRNLHAYGSGFLVYDR